MKQHAATVLGLESPGRTVSIISADRQVVAGTIYHITFSVDKPDFDKELHQVSVFRDLSNNFHLRSDKVVVV